MAVTALLRTALRTPPTRTALPATVRHARAFHSSVQPRRPVIEARDNEKTQTYVYKYSTKGFKINENFLAGSVILFPKDAYMWKVSAASSQLFRYLSLRFPC